MTLHTFSLFLGFASLSVLFGAITLFLLGRYSLRYQCWEERYMRYKHYLTMIGFLAIFSTMMVLIYQLIYRLDVCELCWWQRIWMFPIDIIVIVSLYYGITKNHITILILSLFGIFFSGYHYYYHFRGWVLGDIVSLPCSVGGLLPACTDNDGVFVFGFLTIPGMALSVFVSIAILAVLAHKKAS